MRWLIRDLSTYPETRQSLQRIREDLERRIKDQTLQMQKIRTDLSREVDYRKRVENELRKAREQMDIHTEERTQAMAVANQMLQVELQERKRLEFESEERARQLGELYAATGALLTTLDLEPLLSQILDAATSAIPTAEKGMIHLRGRETGELEMRAAIGYTDPRIQKLNFSNGNSYTMKAVNEHSPLLIHDMQQANNDRFNVSIPEAKAIQSAIIAPLILGEEVLGAISLESSQKRAFTENDLKLLVTFAATVTVAIRNAQLHGEVQMLAITDAVTGVFNRRGFSDLGRREVDRARRFMRPLSVIMFDIDFFKTINDTYGHSCGDNMLRMIAERVKSNIREVDIMGRYGGDEFVILLPETDLFVATNVAERLRMCVSDSPVMIEENPVQVTISLGVARLTADIAGLAALMDRADTAMYAAKHAGRNRVEIG
jgi:diguanylate cyclase (GGDEF)-like protein